jgi:hypothetical protein
VQILDLDGACEVERDDELMTRLRSVRHGVDGAFVLDHGGPESLWVHIHGDAVFLCFFPDEYGRHPGFVPDGMWPGERRPARFRLVGGAEADSITVPWQQLLPVASAYRAAVEYLHSRSRPPSVVWLELGTR